MLVACPVRFPSALALSCVLLNWPAATGLDEPVLFTIRYGKGRIFHTTLGHDVESMRCTGFAATFQRGAEWAAAGRVSQSATIDFPTAQEVRMAA